MSAEWNGNLLKTAIDVIIDTTLVVLIVCAYIPQTSLLQQSISVRGISPYYILFNIFFSNAQLSELLLWVAYAWPTASHPVIRAINNGSLKGLDAFGAVLGLVQVFVQWSCSIAVLMSFKVAAEVDSLEGRAISIIAFLHTAIVLLPVVAMTLPKPAGHTFGKDILMALISMSDRVVAPCCIVLQFVAQCCEMRNQHGKLGALSLLSLGLQVPTMAVLAYRWFLRLGYPTWDRSTPAPIWLWYQWGFPAINYAIHAVACAFLLACYLFGARGTNELRDLKDGVPLSR